MTEQNGLPGIRDVPVRVGDLQAAIQAEQLRQVQGCVRQLPERQQEVLALKFGSGLGNQEIAKAMKITPNHVGVLLHRAVRALRQALEEEEVKE